eukprot:5656003-Prymnesium_polylepis.7
MSKAVCPSLVRSGRALAGQPYLYRVRPTRPHKPHDGYTYSGELTPLTCVTSKADTTKKRLFGREGRTNGAALALGQPARPHALRACTRRARGQHA